MAHVAVMGAGLGGMPMACEMKEQLRKEDRITLVGLGDTHHFVPSSPWVPVSRRKRADIEFPVAPYLASKGIEYDGRGVRRVHPKENRPELNDGSSLGHDFLVIATGPKLAFDEVFGPAREFRAIMDSDLRRRRIRDKAPMTFVTAEPYIGHLGPGGVGACEAVPESARRDEHVKWICNAKLARVEPGKMFVTEHDEDGKPKKEHVLPLAYSMMLRAFKGVGAVFGIEGLANPRGFILIDEHQRDPTCRNIYPVGVCVAIPPVEAAPVPTGAPKTRFMIESMVTAAAHNIGEELDGRAPSHKSACTAVRLAKVGFEKHFLRKLKKGTAEPAFERDIMKTIGIARPKARH